MLSAAKAVLIAQPSFEHLNTDLKTKFRPKATRIRCEVNGLNAHSLEEKLRELKLPFKFETLGEMPRRSIWGESRLVLLGEFQREQRSACLRRLREYREVTIKNQRSALAATTDAKH